MHARFTRHRQRRLASQPRVWGCRQAMDAERLGADVNAFTGKDMTGLSRHAEQLRRTARAITGQDASARPAKQLAARWSG